MAHLTLADMASRTMKKNWVKKGEKAAKGEKPMAKAEGEKPAAKDRGSKLYDRKKG